MNQQEATALLHDTLSGYRRLPYRTLSARVGSEEHLQATGASGTEYQVEVQYFWDRREGGPVRVACYIDILTTAAGERLCRCASRSS